MGASGCPVLSQSRAIPAQARISIEKGGWWFSSESPLVRGSVMNLLTRITIVSLIAAALCTWFAAREFRQWAHLGRERVVPYLRNAHLFMAIGSTLAVVRFLGPSAMWFRVTMNSMMLVCLGCAFVLWR